MARISRINIDQEPLRIRDIRAIRGSLNCPVFLRRYNSLKQNGEMNGFLTRGWPLVIVSLFCGIRSLVEVWRLNCTRAVISAARAVTAVIWGWGISQYPLLIPPSISAHEAKAPDNVLWIMLAVIAAGTVFLLPALRYLLLLFKSEQ